MLQEDEARRVVEEAIERSGGSRFIVGSPRHPFALKSTREEMVEGHEVVIHFSEISAPAIAVLGEWVFEIRETELVVLSRPRPRPAT